MSLCQPDIGGLISHSTSETQLKVVLAIAKCRYFSLVMKRSDQPPTQCDGYGQLCDEFESQKRSIEALEQRIRLLSAGQIVSDLFNCIANKLGHPDFDTFKNNGLKGDFVHQASKPEFGFSQTELAALARIQKNPLVLYGPDIGQLSTFPGDVQALLQKAERVAMEQEEP